LNGLIAAMMSFMDPLPHDRGALHAALVVRHDGPKIGLTSARLTGKRLGKAYVEQYLHN